MSIKEALKYLKTNGLNGEKINSYALVPSGEVLKRALIMFGPVSMGFPVFTDNDPYFWRKGSNYVGGHCVLCVGYNKQGFIIRNSWGTSWADHGYITIPYEEYDASAVLCISSIAIAAETPIWELFFSLVKRFLVTNKLSPIVTLEASFTSPLVLVMLAPGAILILAILSTLATIRLAPTLKYSFQEGFLV